MTFLDQCIIGFDQLLRTALPVWPGFTTEKNPADDKADLYMSQVDKHKSKNMMRVNLAGEVAAQGLYRGQLLLAKDKSLQKHLNDAAIDELAHYVWCLKRLEALGGKPSIFNPLWYWGALSIGLCAALISDEISLGFVIATEEQVGQHLATHLLNIPKTDLQSTAIIAKMYEDELQHAFEAEQKGGQRLPMFVQFLMHLSAQVMIKVTTII